MGENVKDELLNEVKSLGNLVVKNGGGAHLAKKVEDLMNDKIEAKLTNH